MREFPPGEISLLLRPELSTVVSVYVIVIVYQVFVSGSGKYSEVGYPFGYLKASSTNQVVNLIVMPYNYPLLVPLLGMCRALVGSFHCWRVGLLYCSYIMSCSCAFPLPSASQRPSYGDCLEVKREYYQNCSVLDCVTQCSQSAAHLYEQFLQVNRLGLSHWDPYAVHSGSCLELYYCNMVEWFWWDSSLIFDDQLVSFSALTLLVWSSGL